MVKSICDMKQWFTQVGGARPFGVSILFAGVDEDGTAKLFATEPSGIFFQYRATAVGEGEVEINDILTKEYKENINIEDGFRLALNAFKKVLGKNFDINRMGGAYIKISDKKFTKVDVNYIRKVAK